MLLELHEWEHMNQTEKTLIEATQDHLIYEANRFIGKASYDELAYSKLHEAFNLVKNPINWKYPTSVTCQDYTGECRDHILNSAIKYIAAYIFFTGGVEIVVKAKDHVVVSTKGYYHYIGA